MRPALITLLSAISSICLAQWEIQDIPRVTRYDDVFFINENDGWAAGGGQRTIHRTQDGGKTWVQKFVTSDYLRAIEFASPTLGFAGTLNGSLYRSTDSGETWTDITSLLPQTVPGICGLAAPTSTTIYGCGKWHGDVLPFVMKTTDGGDSWMVQDMSQWATQLVDVFFLDENKGFAVGMANPRSDGGIILQTLDGGQNWTVLHKTMVERDYIWKIQTPDSVNFFGSIQSLPSTGNVRFVKSTDEAVTWETKEVEGNKWNYMQMVGFIDANIGWTGGTANPIDGAETALFKTEDGGESWDLEATQISNDFKTFNRFFMLDADNIFMTGTKVYKYNPDGGELPPLSVGSTIEHSLGVYPNPFSDQLSVEISLTNRTSVWLEIFDQNGKVVEEIVKQDLPEGRHMYSLETNALKSGVYFVTLHTNENMFYQRIIKE